MQDNIIEIYGAFKEHAKEFEERMGYGLEDIERIGVDKFIKSMDWTRREQVLSWKTDKAHIIPCIECNSEFAVFEIDFGLCKECQKKYDLREIQKFLEISSKTKSYDEYTLDIASIMQSQYFREQHFLKKKENKVVDINRKKNKKKKNKKKKK